MQYLKKMSDLADKFEAKLSKYGQSPIVSQHGTTELFFGDENKQRSFNTAVQSGALAKFLTDMATKTQKTAGFDLKATANPQKGASWLLTTNPPALKGAVSKYLDAEFRKLTGNDMLGAQAAADKAAKGGAGSGTLDIASFSAEMD
jgi:hypothetical protein